MKLPARLLMFGIAVLMSSMVIAGGPALGASHSEGRQSSSDVAAISGSVRCNASTGQWWVTWTVQPWVTGMSVLEVRDEVNDHTYERPSGPSWIELGQSRNTDTFLLSGAARAASVTVSFMGPDGPAAVTRHLSWSTVCEQEDLLACVPVGEERYQHTFNPATGLAAIEIVGAQPCGSAGITYRGDILVAEGEYRTAGYRVAGIGTTPEAVVFTKALLYVDLPPCSSRHLLAFGNTRDPSPNVLLGAAQAPGSRSTGPLGRFEREQGTCVDSELRVEPINVRTGPRTSAPAFHVTVGNGADAVIPTMFLVSYLTSTGEWRSTYHWTAPGETTGLTIRPGDDLRPPRIRVDLLLTDRLEVSSLQWSPPLVPPRRPI